MKDMGFSPAQVTARVGDTIEWVNDDFVAHTATAKDKWDIVIPPHQKKQLVLKDAGDFGYLCRFHPTMKGKIAVGK